MYFKIDFIARVVFLVLFCVFEAASVDKKIDRTDGDMATILEMLINDDVRFSHCTLSKEFLTTANSVYGCQKIVKQNPICNRSLVVAYSQLEPLVYQNETGDVVGILPDILQETLINRCCLGCNKLVFLPPKDNLRKYTDQLVPSSPNKTTSKADIIIPSKHIDGVREIVLGHHFAKLTQFKNVYFISRTKKTKTTQLVYTLFSSALKSWPLFVVAFILCIGAGIVIWLADMWRNKEHFPRSFPQGPAEGFWWAYVSMTTVGYGDKTPTSTFGRLFAVVWILIGITIFNMFTATITSALNKELMEKVQFSPFNQQIGMIKDLKFVENTILNNYGTPKEFSLMRDLIKALRNGTINAIAIDDLTYKKFHPSIRPPFAVQLEIPITGHSVGFASTNLTLKNMQDTFNTNLMETLQIQSHAEPIDIAENLHVPDDMPEITKVFSINNTYFIIVTVSVIGMSVLMLVIGIAVNRCQRRKKDPAMSKMLK